MDAPKVFISYVREDAAAAERLFDDLTNEGCEPWLDTRFLLPGQIWRDEIRRAITESDYFIALLSTNSVSKRGYFQKELKDAMSVREEIPEGQSYLIPARLDECEIANLALQAIQWVDLYTDYELGIRRMLASLFSRQFAPEASAEKPIYLYAIVESAKGSLASLVTELSDLGLVLHTLQADAGVPGYDNVFVKARSEPNFDVRDIQNVVANLEIIHRLVVLDPDYASGLFKPAENATRY